MSDKDAEALLEEMGNLGQVRASERANGTLTVWVDSTCTPDDIEAVCCFIVDADQLNIAREAAPGAQAPAAPVEQFAQAAEQFAAQAQAQAPAPAAVAPAPAAPAVAESAAAAEAITQAARATRAAPAHADKESTSIRVGVEKVDQIINLVGELVITQAMLAQTASTLDPVLHDRLLNGMEQLERNARDLQEAVMSIRMMPMDYVFSRFPRLVRDIAGKMGKQIELQTYGRATELDKSLIERIIDPLTHLVRNSLDHGIETPEARGVRQGSRGPAGAFRPAQRRQHRDRGERRRRRPEPREDPEEGHVAGPAGQRKLARRRNLATDLRARLLHGREGHGHLRSWRGHGRGAPEYPGYGWPRAAVVRAATAPPRASCCR